MRSNILPVRQEPVFNAIVRLNNDQQLPNYILFRTIFLVFLTCVILAKQRNKVREIVMDFPKAFDTLNGNLMCKVKTYGFDETF